MDDVFTAELDFVAEESARTNLVDHTTADTTTVDHDTVGMVLVVDADDFAGELGGGISVITKALDGASVADLCGEDD